jgi:anti-anti-sigma regulatory factor
MLYSDRQASYTSVQEDVMEISARYTEAKVPVTIMALDGELDAHCYLDVIQEAIGLYDTGTRDLVIDMSNLNFMASSGLVALHSVALIMRGEKPPDAEKGWAGFRTADTYASQGANYETHCKLLNPHQRVQHTLEMAGFGKIFEIFMDEKEAVASFG